MIAMPGEKFQRSLKYQKRRSGSRKDHNPVARYRKGNRGNRNVHHLTNKVKGGDNAPSNLLLMKVDRHAQLHHYFKNMSWEEIGDALYSMFGLRDPKKCHEAITRISRLKGRAA